MLKKILLAAAALLLMAAAMPLAIMLQDARASAQSAEDIRPADAAVVLSTKAYENGRLNPCLAARVEGAVALYRAGKVGKLIMSGGINRDFHYGSRTMQALAEKMGVPPEAIEQEDRSATTFENIIFSRPLIENRPRVVIVSAGFHLLRARMMAEKQWPQHDIQTYAAPFCAEPHGGYAFTVLRESGAMLKNALKGRF